MIKGRAQVSHLARVALATFVFIGICEASARAYLYVRDQQPDYRTKVDAYAGQSWVEQYFREDQKALVEWRPYVYWRHMPFKGQFINVDKDGYRATYNNGSPDSTRLVYLLGGSTLWGTGARDEFTIPSLVSKQLWKMGCRDFYVKNLGEIGFVSTQEVVQLMLALHETRAPSVVVFYDGINDIWSSYQNGVAGIPINEANRRTDFNASTGANLLVPTIRHLGLYRIAEMAARRMAAASPTVTFNNAQLRNDVLAYYSANMRIVRSLSNEYGFAVRFFWQPVVYSKKTKTPWEDAEIAKLPRDVSDIFSGVYGLVDRSNELRSASDFTDISSVFNSTSATTFIDTWHVTESGNDAIANLVADMVRGSLGCQK